MKYKIVRLTFGPNDDIEIDQNEYNEIVAAVKNLYEILYMEEVLDSVTENFYEYENELLSIASRIMLFQNDTYHSRNNDRNTVSRRIANLLSACRMYVDQSTRHIKNIYGKESEELNQLEAQKNSQYDQQLGYRVLEALRNYVQHRGVPIHNIVFSYHTVDNKELSRLLHHVVPKIRVKTLEQDRNFKRSIIPELKAIAIKDEVDIRPLIREYVGSIGKIQEYMREFLKSDIEYWESIVEKAISKYHVKFGEDVSITGLSVVVEDDNGTWSERTGIFRGISERRRYFAQKNSIFNNLDKRYASNEIWEKPSYRERKGHV